MASGMVAYLGAFDVVYRKAIINEWQVRNYLIFETQKTLWVFVVMLLLHLCPCSQAQHYQLFSLSYRNAVQNTKLSVHQTFHLWELWGTQ